MSLNSEELYTHKPGGLVSVCDQNQKEGDVHHKSVVEHFQNPEFDFHYARPYQNYGCHHFIFK